MERLRRHFSRWRREEVLSDRPSMVLWRELVNYGVAIRVQRGRELPLQK